jgi:hypothetical protein
MDDDRPITPEQALLAVKAAGLDTDRSLSEQLNGPTPLDEQTVRGWVSEAISEAMAPAGQGSAGQPATPDQRERQFAEGYRDALVKAQSRWFAAEGGDDAAA